MPAVVRRILTHAVLTIASLAIVGLMLAHIATMAIGFVADGDIADSNATTEVTDSLFQDLYWQLPLRLAAIGFIIVLAGEGLICAFRRRHNSNMHHK